MEYIDDDEPSFPTTEQILSIIEKEKMEKQRQERQLKREAERLKKTTGWKFREIKNYGSLTKQPMIYTTANHDKQIIEASPVE